MDTENEGKGSLLHSLLQDWQINDFRLEEHNGRVMLDVFVKVVWSLYLEVGVCRLGSICMELVAFGWKGGHCIIGG